MARHLLVTNDFPPKIGGIQSYLYELWRRLDPSTFSVLTTPHDDAAAFDAAQPFEIIRDRDAVFVPHRRLVDRIDHLASRIGADLVVLDPLAPIGAAGPRLASPYAVVVHGAEVTVPANFPPFRTRMAAILERAELVIAAGSFPAAEAERVAGSKLELCVVPPGVDTDRFVVPTTRERAEARARYGVDQHAPVIASISRLVPRKGMDVLIEATARLQPEFGDLTLLIGGQGRDQRRLERLARESRAPVRFLGRVPDADLPSFLGMADLFAMCCRNRWAGLEQEGFGIVFLEAAACGVPQVAGRSGGSADAVVDGQTGLVVDEPASVGAVTSALRELLVEPSRARDFGVAARKRAVADFSYVQLAERLAASLEATVARLG